MVRSTELTVQHQDCNVPANLDSTEPVATGWPDGMVGNATLSAPDPAVVGEFGTWTFRYEVGPYGIDDGGGLKLLFPIPSDRGIPQFDDPTAPNYTTVRCSGTARVVGRYATKLHYRPWVKGIALDVEDGPLAPGDVIEVVIGDVSGGSPGALAQSYSESQSVIRAMVDPFATSHYYDIPGELGHPVLPGAAAALVASAPSTAKPGDGLNLYIRAIDRYGNVATGAAGSVTARAGNYVVKTELARGLALAKFPEVVAGTLRFDVESADLGLRVLSNPVLVSQSADDLLWGDTQGQTGETVGSGSLDDFFRYARDAAGLDFVTHSANDFQVEDDFYAEVLEATDKYNEPGGFVAFGGFEWSGNTPVGGDHNVLYADNAQAPLLRSSRALVSHSPDDGTDCRTIAEVCEVLRRDHIDALCVAHVGGRLAELEMLDPEFTPVLEIVSVHGWFEWFALDALRLGHKVGFVGASDDHSGRPGASFPSLPLFGVRSGLAAVYCADRTRSGILQALRERKCFATSGERIVLDVRHRQHRMGQEWATLDVPELDISVSGTSGIEQIDILDAEGVAATWMAAPGAPGQRLRVSWRGARSKFRSRVQNWDGELRVVGARIVGASTWAFDHPDQGIVSWDADGVTWRSSTNGDHDGLILEFDGVPKSLHFQSGEVDLNLPLAALGGDPMEFPIDGGVDRAVEMRWLPAEPPEPDVRVRLKPGRHRVGDNAWLVRVTQADGHRAWSSPMFVNVQSENARTS